MPFQYGYTSEKFHQAVLALASSSESIQERLGSACSYYLSRLKSEDIPDEFKDDFKQIQELQITERPNGSMIAVNLSDEEADRIAEKIVLIYDDLAQRLGVYDAQYESRQKPDH
jgi:hypothetical protein